MKRAKKQKSWRVFLRKTVHKNPWFKVVKEDIKKPGGFRGDYFIFSRHSQKDFVIVVAEENDQFYLVKQWRPTLKRYLLEFVAGGTNKNETYLQAAKRELVEEVGLKAKKWQYLGNAAVAPGHSDQYGRVFLAKKLTKSQEFKSGEIGEQTQLIKINCRKFHQMVLKFKINDGPTLSAYLMYLAFLKKI